MSVVGQAWHPGHLEDAAEDALRTWMPAMLNEVIAQDPDAPKKVKVPSSYNVMSEDQRWPEEQLPAIIIASPGMVENPDRGDGAGTWKATWALEVTAICRGRTDTETRRLAQIYWSAICLSVLQRRSLGDENYAATLIDSALDAVPIERRRTLAGATALFHVEVQSMFSGFDGPRTSTPPDPMPDTWPTVLETNIETEIA